MGETSNTAGGFLVPSQLSAEIIDLARAKSVVVQAGAQTIPMESDRLTMARLEGDPTFQVKTENAKFAQSDATFGAISFTSNTLGTVVAISRELAQDAPNAASKLEEALSLGIATEIDRLALIGSGSQEPNGLKNISGIGEITGIGAIISYDELVSGIVKVMEANGEPNAYVLPPRTFGTFMALTEAANGQYLKPPSAVEKLAQFVTTSIPTTDGAGSNESSIYLGDFSQLLIGLRQGVNIEVSTNAGEAFERHQVLIKVTWRGDFNLAQEAHFVRLSGITN